MNTQTSGYAIILNALVPLRASASEAAEMETQLLFGELIIVNVVEGRWAHVQNVTDGMEGWVDLKMITSIPTEEYERLAASSLHIINYDDATAEVISGDYDDRVDHLDANNLVKTWMIKLPYGAHLPGFDLEERSIYVNGLMYQIATPSNMPIIPTAENFMEIAFEFMGAPYLWGGKSIFGCDCSGFIQVAAAVNGVQLPRNASEQFHCGTTVATLADAKRGDLVFYATADGKVSHVAILLTEYVIYHASGYVHADKIDEQGNILSKITTYDHYHMVGIKRIFA